MYSGQPQPSAYGYPPMPYPGQPGAQPQGQPQAQGQTQTQGQIVYPSMGQGATNPQQQMQPQAPMMQPGMQQPGMYPPQYMYQQPGMYPPPPQYMYMQPGMHQPGMYQPAPPQPYGVAGVPGMMTLLGPGSTKSISFNEAEDAARRLYGAFKGLGTDSKEVIAVLSSYNKCQLNEISMVYQQKYSRSLPDALKSEISGRYLQLALTILYQPFKLEAHLVSKAIKSGSLDDSDAIGEILATRTPADLQQIAMAYQMPAFGLSKKKQKKTKSFVEFVLNGTSSHKDMHNFARAVLTGLRPAVEADPVQASRDAKDLIIAAKGLGTDEPVFFDIFAHRSFTHLAKVAEEVKVQRKKTLEWLVKSEFIGVMERTLLYVLYMTKSPAHAQAYIIYKAVKGAGTRDDALIRTIAYIYDNDMLDKVKVAFKEICGKDMVKYVESDTTLKYRKLCVALLNYKGKKLETPLNVGYK